MQPLDKKARVTASVLDRLLDFDPDSSKDPPMAAFRSLEELKRSVRRDLGWLLNSRQVPGIPIGSDSEIKKSVISYGLPDFTATDIKNLAEKKSLIAAISQALELFEPRFLDINVTLEPITDTQRQIKFKIAAKLDAEPAPVPIVFDTVLQLGNGEFSVRED